MAHIQVPGICGPIVFTLETSQARSHPPLDQTHLGKFDLLVCPGFDLLLAAHGLARFADTLSRVRCW
jgi:hypothetical protein